MNKFKNSQTTCSLLNYVTRSGFFVYFLKTTFSYAKCDGEFKIIGLQS